MDLRQLSCWKGYIIFTYMQHGRPDRILGLANVSQFIRILTLWDRFMVTKNLSANSKPATKYDNPQTNQK